MSLIWTSLQSIAGWSGNPSPPRVARAAVEGLGWLVATEASGGWSVTFVPDASAANPPEDETGRTFQAAKVDWKGHREKTHAHAPHPPAKHAAETHAPKKTSHAKAAHPAPKKHR